MFTYTTEILLFIKSNQQFLHGEAFMATAANKNKIRTFETEIGPQNKNIEAG